MKISLVSLFTIIFGLLNAIGQNDTMFIISNGNVSHKIALSEIDSIIFYNPEPSIPTNSSKETISDIDGNLYETTTIGEQVWMASNLNVTRYNNGDEISTTDAPDTNIDNETEPKYYWAYNGIESNSDIYGKLYTWWVAIDSRNICPEGWHVPSLEEWNELQSYIQTNGSESTFLGNMLKETGTDHWAGSNSSATDEFGFKALPGGFRMSSGQYYDLGTYANFWTSSEHFAGAYVVELSSIIESSDSSEKHGISIRCLKD